MAVIMNDLAKRIIEVSSTNKNKQLWIQRIGLKTYISIEDVDITDDVKYIGEIEEAIEQLLIDGYIRDAYRGERFTFLK
jgi:hypothetical protein